MKHHIHMCRATMSSARKSDNDTSGKGHHSYVPRWTLEASQDHIQTGKHHDEREAKCCNRIHETADSFYPLRYAPLSHLLQALSSALSFRPFLQALSTDHFLRPRGPLRPLRPMIDSTKGRGRFIEYASLRSLPSLLEFLQLCQAIIECLFSGSPASACSPRIHQAEAVPGGPPCILPALTAE